MDDFVNDGRGRVTVAEWGEYWIDILPMIYNHRVVMTPKADVTMYEWGWCYRNWSHALSAVFLWDPETEGEPANYAKHATESRGTRKAGQTARAQPDHT